MVVDLQGAELRDNPYPLYNRLREEEPVSWIKLPFLGKARLLTRYEDVQSALKDPRVVNDRRNAGIGGRWEFVLRLPGIFRVFQDSMVSLDGDAHRRLRNLVHKSFTPAYIQKLSARVQTITDELLDRALSQREFDLREALALPLPLTLVSEMVGVPEKDRMDFYRWTGFFLDISYAGMSGIFKAIGAGFNILSLFKRLIAERRAEPRDDLLTALVQAEEEGEALSNDELLSMLFLLLLAGHETTLNLIATGTLELLQHPDQLERLRAEPALLDSAIEELLRFGNPVVFPGPRFASTDLEYQGVTIRRGETLMLSIAAANRDPRVFSQPDVLDLGRTPNKHLAFGTGMHACMGAPLARLEARTAFRSLLERAPRLQLAVPYEDLKWKHALQVRGLKALPVRLG